MNLNSGEDSIVPSFIAIMYIIEVIPSSLVHTCILLFIILLTTTVRVWRLKFLSVTDVPTCVYIQTFNEIQSRISCLVLTHSESKVRQYAVRTAVHLWSECWLILGDVLPHCCHTNLTLSFSCINWSIQLLLYGTARFDVHSGVSTSTLFLADWCATVPWFRGLQLED